MGDYTGTIIGTVVGLIGEDTREFKPLLVSTAKKTIIQVLRIDVPA